jgi:tryptophan synthase alpha chain
MSRFAATFERLRRQRACGLFPYLMAGYPDVATSESLAHAALEAGADGFEIGVPFSDPLADGATIQRANGTALSGGATLDTALALARTIRRASPETPIALMSYFNPLLHRGLESFASALSAAGGDAVIVPDLPMEEAGDLDQALAAHALDFVPLLAPTSTDERLKRIVTAARGFVYCVSLVGVTGARNEISTALPAFLGRVRAVSQVPIAVGFGIARPEHIRTVCGQGADAAIVASALVDLIERSPEPAGPVRDLLREMKAAGSPAAAS